MPEQSQADIEAMQEKLKNMSPEELKEFQKQNCIFCQIISGKVNSKKVYEDDKCLAILDINPANPGHVLLMPKEHYAIMPLMPEDTIKHLFMISKQISGVLLKSLQAEGTNIFVANGAVAGQKAQHFMIHVIPRMEKDDLKLDITSKKADNKELEEIRKVLVSRISKDLGGEIKEDDVEEEPIEVKKEEKQDTKPKKETKKKSKDSKEVKTKVTEKEPKEEVSLDDIASLITGAS